MGAVQNAICDGTSCYYEASCDKHLNISMRVTIPKANGGFKEFVIDEYYLKVPGNVLDPLKVETIAATLEFSLIMLV